MAAIRTTHRETTTSSGSKLPCQVAIARKEADGVRVPNQSSEPVERAVEPLGKPVGRARRASLLAKTGIENGKVLTVRITIKTTKLQSPPPPSVL